MVMPFSGAGVPDEPRMTHDELQNLLIYIIRSPAVYSEARRLIDLNYWDPHFERNYLVLIGGFFAVADTKLYEIENIHYAAVHTEVRCRMDDDPILKSNAHAIKNIIGRPTDPDPYNGLLYHACHGVDEDELHIPYGMMLLKKFLHERQVIDKVRQVLDGAGGRIPIGFKAKLVQAQETAAAIEAIGRPCHGRSLRSVTTIPLRAFGGGGILLELHGGVTTWVDI